MEDTWHTPIPIDAAVALRGGRFLAEHRDPFDRVLAAQALEDDIPILSGNLHARGCACALVQHVPPPWHGAGRHNPLVPIDSERLVRTWIMVVRVVAFARD